MIISFGYRIKSNIATKLRIRVFYDEIKDEISIKLNILREGLNIIIKKLTSFLMMSTKYAKMLTYKPEMSTK